MPYIRPKKCKGCGSSAEEGPISARGWCVACALELMTETQRQVHDRQGPAYNLWRVRRNAGIARYLARAQAELAEDAERQDAA